MIAIYDAPRCPYCARVRIVLAEKAIPHELVAVNLDERPAFLYELNPPKGKVPILEEEAFVLPESAVIMEYLEERFPEPALLPADPAERAEARLLVFRFDDFSDLYYDLYFGRPAGSEERVRAALAALDGRLEGRPYLAGRDYGLADIAYVPWIFRCEQRLGLDLSSYRAIGAWVERLLARPAIAAERDVVAAL